MVERWGQVSLVGLGGGRWAGVTDLAAPAVRHLPPNLRVTHGPAIMANGIPGGSPTRAPSSLGPREPPLPPFGEPMLGSIGRQLCLSRPGPRLPSLLRAGPGLRGPRGRLAPGCAHVEPGWVGIGGGAGLGVLGTCPGLRLRDDHCARVHMVCMCVPALGMHVEKMQRLHTPRTANSRACTLLNPTHFLAYGMSSGCRHNVLCKIGTVSPGLPTETSPIRETSLPSYMIGSKLEP